jgi:uncharacterized protein (TIGR00251 family)
LTLPPFLRRTATGVTVELSVQPRARRDALELRSDQLRAAVTQPAEEGKANAAVIALLAEAWRFPKSAFAVVRGAGARRKVLSVAGEPDLLAGRIADWMREHG